MNIDIDQNIYFMYINKHLNAGIRFDYLFFFTLG